MGLERWENQYKEHPAWSVAADLITLLNSSESRVTLDERDYFDRLKSGLSYISEMANEPALVVTGTALGNLHQSLVNIQSNVLGWSTGGGSNPLTNAAGPYLDGAFDAIRGWPPSKDRYARGTRAAANEFVSGAQTALDVLREEVASLRREIESQSAGLQADFSGLLEAAKEKVEAAEVEVSSLRSEVDAMSATVATQSQRLDQAINAYQTSYSEAEAARAEGHQRALEKLSEETVAAAERSKAQAESVLGEQRDSGQGLLDEVEMLRDQTVQLVNAVGLTGTATEYGKYASQEQKAANNWRRGAVGAFACSFLLFLVTLLVSPVDGKTPWQVIVIRFGGSLVLLAGGLYMSRESAQHRQEERRAKSIQLDLAALDPFIVNLPAEQRQSIKAAAANRLFVEPAVDSMRNDQQVGQNANSDGEGLTPDTLRALQGLAEIFNKK
ncbi:hypothetical protein ABT234_29490 [Streptomyces sp. NPDC001586]|uniref:hypothetical protein n=1 Tax=Streptomyces sp. NPDC001586 TaxID=3154387 RepID=UPI00332DB47A